MSLVVKSTVLLFFCTLSIQSWAASLMFQANLERTGVYEGTGPQEEPELAWKFSAGAPVLSTPLVYGGMVYFVDFEGGVYGVEQESGLLIWEKNLAGQPSFQIAVDENFLLVGRRFSREDNESYLMAVDRLTGEEVWRFEPDDRTGMDTPAIYNGKVFLTSMSENIFSLNLETGEEIWRFPVEGGDRQLLISDGVVYFQGSEQEVYAFDEADGNLIWSYYPPISGDSYFITPAMDECCIYAMANEHETGSILVIDRHNGEEKAEFSVGEITESSSISLFEGVLFFGDDGGSYGGDKGSMNAIDTNSGDLIWKVETQGNVSSSAAIAGDMVYFGSYDRHLYAVDLHTGEVKWTYEVSDGIASSPAVVDGRVYFGSIDGHVYVLE